MVAHVSCLGFYAIKVKGHSLFQYIFNIFSLEATLEKKENNLSAK
jgi:hypothetical protein